MSRFSVASVLGCLALVACASARQAPPVAWKAPEIAHFRASPVEVAAEEPAEHPPAPVTAEKAPPKTEMTAPAPTWTAIYARHLGPGTAGACARARACHAETASDASSTYSWLAQRGYIAGAQSALIGSNSCLRWFGGNMPPRASKDEDAVRDLEAWVAAGAADN
jgi:hypothetical protein